MSAQKMQSFNDETAIRSYLQLLARYERLMEISRQLTSTLDLRSLLNKIIQAATELTDAEEASILLVDQKSGELRFEAASRLSPGAMEAIVVPTNSIAGWIVQHGEPVLVEDSEHENRIYRGVDNVVQHETRNMLGVPMIVHDKVIGVVEAINKRSGVGWNEDDVSTLSTLAAQAAVAIENARLFQQSDFIDEMVHELRTPLLALKTSTALLNRTDIPLETHQGVVHTMQGEIDRLTHLTTDFLDLARLESGRTKIDMARYQIVSLVNDSVTIVSPQAEAKAITITVNGDPNTVLIGDHDKIKQVLLNLLTNAIKYNRKGGRIDIDVTPDKEPNMTRVSVADTGLGMSEDDLKQLFKKFFRADKSADTVQGTGLGLVIARHIIEAHGGTMGVTSKLDVGTTFYFVVPTAPPVEANSDSTTKPTYPTAL